jgi:5-methylcytosine-specific restriction endonuclease McrBC regulatory subunit McrC
VADALTDPGRIKLQEYGSPVVRQVEYLDLHALAEANKRWSRALGLSGDPIRVEDIGDGLVKLRAEAVTGIVRIGDIDIEIAPKFLNAAAGSWQTVLWRILTIVEGGHVDDNLTTAHQLASLSLPDLLAEMFLASYAKGAARGLPRGYRAEQAAGNTLRGSLDQSRLGEWMARPWKLPYVADLLTDDTALARLLRWSAECLAATVKAPGRARAVREIAAGLAHVGGQPPHLLDAQRISLGIQHQGLEAARVVGLLLLEGAGVHHARGDHALSGFLWDSDDIYENYVYWLCRRAASQRGKRVDKGVIQFGEIIAGAGTKLETTPDVVFRNAHGFPVAVTDSKYKLLGSRPKAPDTYQVMTAGHVLGCQRVSLTYPVDVDRNPTVWRVPSALGGSDIELTALPLNLMGLTRPDGPQALIDTISAWLDGELFAEMESVDARVLEGRQHELSWAGPPHPEMPLGSAAGSPHAPRP